MPFGSGAGMPAQASAEAEFGSASAQSNVMRMQGGDSLPPMNEEGLVQMPASQGSEDQQQQMMLGGLGSITAPPGSVGSMMQDNGNEGPDVRFAQVQQRRAQAPPQPRPLVTPGMDPDLAGRPIVSRPWPTDDRVLITPGSGVMPQQVMRFRTGGHAAKPLPKGE